ncbi:MULTISPECIES: type VI secretion system lipoprotein TssJ [unclassified Shinella]|uniref:type VI secretion system lipoprotein TssJ n=1 Tax=unclassified Shinella TaxID=2643062 RepID=UPI00234E45EE|nr:MULTISPECIES: type VI secretion system lipoprotein TssJ [unclassified Shinella]MCO5151381.1 type VI secretion system lipoprotein TssJ [Shinella sp.]MDC7266262.1 type VI secretion system lipoprotein TssJ [Shinella sp. HY16]MDC7273159.1 type VI secretion system lipoprotein TssJ [Shinella sp. YZ44]
MTTGLYPVRWWLAGLCAALARPFAFLCLGLVAFSLAGCGAFGAKKPPPTEIEIKPAPVDASLDVIAVASPLVNPGPDGLPQPVVMRLYQLNGETAFANASFRQLWEADAETLGPTMLGKTELYFAPGEVQRVKANLIEGTTIIAVVVGFRNFEEAKWRAMVGLQGDKKFKLKAELKTLSIELGPQD